MKKILVVDDNAIVLETLSTLLSANDYRVLSAMDAMQATMQAIKLKPDLILLDIMMPAGGGFSVYERLKKNPETQAIPIVFLSGYPLESLQGKLSVLDKDRFIAKPWDNDKLLAAIKGLLDKDAIKEG